MFLPKKKPHSNLYEHTYILVPAYNMWINSKDSQETSFQHPAQHSMVREIRDILKYNVHTLDKF